MRHIVATIVCVSAIGIYTLFSCWYIGEFSADISGSLQYCNEQNYSQESIEKLKSSFQSKENILTLMVNKEHIDEVENWIAEIESAALFNNMQDIKTNTNLLINTVEDIKNLF